MLSLGTGLPSVSASCKRLSICGVSVFREHEEVIYSLTRMVWQFLLLSLLINLILDLTGLALTQRFPSPSPKSRQMCIIQMQGYAEEFQEVADHMDVLLGEAHNLGIAQSQHRDATERLLLAWVPPPPASPGSSLLPRIIIA
jgi:hypothetical protein